MKQKNYFRCRQGDNYVQNSVFKCKISVSWLMEKRRKKVRSIFIWTVDNWTKFCKQFTGPVILYCLMSYILHHTLYLQLYVFSSLSILALFIGCKVLSDLVKLLVWKSYKLWTKYFLMSENRHLWFSLNAFW